MNGNIIIPEEVIQFRQDTSGCSKIVHFNNAGASLPTDSVMETVIAYLREEALVGGYEAEARNSEKFEEVYELIARLIGAAKEEVAICENASAAWGTAFKGLPFAAGDEIITCELEYVSNLLALIDIQKHGVVVKIIHNDENGNFPLEDLEENISRRTKLILITHIPSSGGGILPIHAIGKIAKKYGILYMVDACHTAGHYPIDVNKIGCDILSATGRKYLRAPRGTGFLFVRREVQHLIRPYLLDFNAARNITLEHYDLRQDARRFGLYEKSRALTLGLGKAIEYALHIGVDRIWERVKALAFYARTELQKIAGITVHDMGNELCGIVTFSAEGLDNLALRDALIAIGINVSYGGPAATLIYMTHRNITGMVRASIYYYNTEEEILLMCEALKNLPELKARHVSA